MRSEPPDIGPELVFALAGAVGTDLGMVAEVLANLLGEVGYDAHQIGLSSLLDLIDWDLIKASIPSL